MLLCTLLFENTFSITQFFKLRQGFFGKTFFAVLVLLRKLHCGDVDQELPTLEQRKLSFG